MYGAVLWSDRSNGRALIWCEDHGNLAFFDRNTNEIAETSEFEEGDLVKFKVRDGCGMRLALDVSVISSEEYPYLADDLREATQTKVTPPTANPFETGAKIVPFKQTGVSSSRRERLAPGSDRKSCAS